MKTYRVDYEKYLRNTKRYDSETSESSNNFRSFRVRREYEARSYGNDVGCQYEPPGRSVNRIKRKTLSHMEANQRYVIESREMAASDIPTFVYDDITRTSCVQPPRPILEDYESRYVIEEPLYTEHHKIPKLAYANDRHNTWRYAARPIETRYFTEDLKARKIAYASERSAMFHPYNTGPIVEARYVTDNQRVPKLIHTDVRRRAMVDASVGSVTPWKKVTKIYLPEMRNRGTGSSDLSPYIAQLRDEPSPFHSSVTTSCGYDSLLPLPRSNVKIPNGPPPPYVSKVSANTSARTATELIETFTQANSNIENIDDIPEKLFEKSLDGSFEGKKKSKPTVLDKQDGRLEKKMMSMPGAVDVILLKESTVDNQPPSELIKLIDLETSGQKRSRIATNIKEEVGKEISKIFTVESDNLPKSDSKKLLSPIPKLGSESVVRRRFEALRKPVEQDKPTHDNYVSQATSRISFGRKDAAISPGLSPQGSNSYTKEEDYRFDYQYSEPSSSPKSKGRHTSPDGGRYKFRLWGHKRNEVDFDESKEQSARKKVEAQSRPLKIKETDYETEKKKAKKLFFFGKNSKGKDRFELGKAHKQKVTAGRCDVPGVSLRIGGAHLLQHQRAKHSDTIENAWLDNFMLGVLESTENVHVRWNNNCFKTSSTTILELMDTVYQDAIFEVNSKNHQSAASVYRNEDKRVNFFQNIQTFMVHKTIRNVKSSQSNDKLYYDNYFKTITRKIELVMRANDFTMFRHSTECSKSSVDIKIKSLKSFLDDASDEQVYKITDYEDLKSTISDLPLKKKLVTLDAEEVAVIPTTSMNSCLRKRRDVFFRESCILIPERCEVISVLMQRSRRRYCNTQSQLKIYDEEDGSLKKGKTLQEVYRSWLGKFNWFGKDDRSCRSDEIDVNSLRQLYIIEEEGSIQSKSCPTLNEFEEYQLAPKLSVININKEAQKQEEHEKLVEPRENVAKKITDKIFSVFKRTDQDPSVRLYPKDSIAVCKKRMKLAAILKKWQEHDVCETSSVQSNVTSKAIGIQWDTNYIPISSEKRTKEVSQEPASILAHSSKKDKKKETFQQILIDPIPQSDQILAEQSPTASDEIEKETAIVLPMIEADTSKPNISSAEVYCKTQTFDINCKQIFDKDLDVFRNAMKTLGTPLPDCSDCIANAKNASDHNLYAPEYQFCPRPEKCSENSDTSDGKASIEDLNNLRGKLNTLSETTLKSLEMLDQLNLENNDNDIKRDSNCECSNPNTVLQIEETQTKTGEGISNKSTKVPSSNNNTEQESQNMLKNVKANEKNLTVDSESQKKVEDVDVFHSSKEQNFISCGCKNPTLHTKNIEKPKDTSYIQSVPADPSCTFCNNCPTCSKLMNQVSASTSPKESLLQKNQITGHSDPSSTQRWPNNRGHASEHGYDHKGTDLSRETQKEASFKSDRNYTASCDKKISPLYRKDLETSASFNSWSSSHKTCKAMCPSKLPSPKYQLEDLQQEYYGSRDEFCGLKRVSPAVPVPKTETPSAPKLFNEAPASKKCVACIRKPWWLGGTGAPPLPASTVPGHEGISPPSELAGASKLSEYLESSQSIGCMKRSTTGREEHIYRANENNQYKVILPSICLAPSEKLVKYAKVEQTENFRGREKKKAATSIYNMIEDRLDVLPTENTNQNQSLRDEIIDKIKQLDMPKIVEIDSKETMLIGSKRKTASTEEIRGSGTPDSVKTQRFPKTSIPADAPNKCIELTNENDQIEISFKVKIGSGGPVNIVNSTAPQRYQTHPEVYVLENREGQTETVKASNDVNIQIIIKPHSPRSEHNITKATFPNLNSIKRNTDTSRTYSVNRSATELSIQKEESESDLKVNWQPGSDGAGTSFNSESSSKEQSEKQTIQRAIKPVNIPVASPFKVMHKTPITDLDTASVGTDMEETQSPIERDRCCLECGSDRDDLTEANTQITIGTDSMRNYYSPSSLSDDKSNPSKTRANSTCSGPYIERIKTLNSKPRSKLIQTYSKNENKHSYCYCKKSGNPSNRFKEARPVMINTTKNQSLYCNIVNELLSEDNIYYEVTDTGTQYFKPPDCVMCFVKKHPKAQTKFFQPVDVRMINVQHTISNIPNLQPNVKYDENSLESEETDVSETSLKRKLRENRSNEVKAAKQKTLYDIPADILQSKEVKKAVLKLYTEKHESKNDEMLGAKLPKFVYERESDITKLADRYCEEPPESSRVKSAKKR